MISKQILLATITGSLVLFLFDGAFQAIPQFGVRAVERLETNEITTGNINQLTNRMAYIVTDHTVSFTATQHAGYYNLSRFFFIEFLSAFSIAFLFALLFSKLRVQHLKDRLSLTLSFALIAALAIHLPYFNWWGFSLSYTAGVIVKTVSGWLLIAYIQNRFIFKIR